MSINAYPVFDTRMGKISFNLYRDGELVDFLNAEIDIYSCIHDGCGMIEIPVETLIEAAAMPGELKISDKTMQRLKSNIRYARKHDNDTVAYYCF
jgi:hypothetical protein